MPLDPEQRRRASLMLAGAICMSIVLATYALVVMHSPASTVVMVGAALCIALFLASLWQRMPH